MILFSEFNVTMKADGNFFTEEFVMKSIIERLERLGMTDIEVKVKQLTRVAVNAKT